MSCGAEATPLTTMCRCLAVAGFLYLWGTAGLFPSCGMAPKRASSGGSASSEPKRPHVEAEAGAAKGGSIADSSAAERACHAQLDRERPQACPPPRLARCPSFCSLCVACGLPHRNRSCVAAHGCPFAPIRPTATLCSQPPSEARPARSSRRHHPSRLAPRPLPLTAASSTRAIERAN
jgi:hypothetical protein